MKVSVLLPTRSGGRLLANCLESVLGQDDPDIELVVSDNANTDETPDILAGRARDSRLKAVRQDKVLSVTDNWLAAYRASTGDYLVLIGDDDYLLPGFFLRLRSLLDQWGHPDCLTYSAYAFVSPSAIDTLEGGYYADPHFAIAPAFLASGALSAAARATIVADMFRFRPRLPLNLQSTVFSRVAAERLPRGLFRPPFPDHYALNGMLLTAGSWACASDRLLTIGVSPQSFGHYAFSGRSDHGMKYLGSEIDLAHRLPGNDLLTAMYCWLLLLQEDFPQADALRISRGDYVVRQLWDWIRAWRMGNMSLGVLIGRVTRLSPGDWLRIVRLTGDREILTAAWTRLSLPRSDRPDHFWLGLQPTPASVRTMPDFAAWVTSGDPLPSV